jgi:hypothetical protein
LDESGQLEESAKHLLSNSELQKVIKGYVRMLKLRVIVLEERQKRKEAEEAIDKITDNLIDKIQKEHDLKKLEESQGTKNPPQEKPKPEQDKDNDNNDKDKGKDKAPDKAKPEEGK